MTTMNANHAERVAPQIHRLVSARSHTLVRGDRLALLGEEINRLLSRYRDPLMLCELEGESRQDDALQFGLAERLSRCRRRPPGEGRADPLGRDSGRRDRPQGLGDVDVEPSFQDNAPDPGVVARPIEAPAFVLVGPDGKIVARGMRGDDVKQEVAKALAKP
jgi:hypothetical protein